MLELFFISRLQSLHVKKNKYYPRFHKISISIKLIDILGESSNFLGTQ